MAAMLTSAMAFVACDDKDVPVAPSKYELVVPCMDWEKATHEDVRAYVKEHLPNFQETTFKGQNLEEELAFENKTTNTDMFYFFSSNGTLHYAQVTYFSINNMIDQLKNDWEKQLGITFKKEQVDAENYHYIYNPEGEEGFHAEVMAHTQDHLDLLTISIGSNSLKDLK